MSENLRGYFLTHTVLCSHVGSRVHGTPNIVPLSEYRVDQKVNPTEISENVLSVLRLTILNFFSLEHSL